MSDRIGDELDTLDLGDERLNRRGKRLLETLFADPAASINAACHGWSDTAAAYRFFDNKSVQPEKILQAHREATTKRMNEHAVVLIAQDTTEFDYTDHPPADAGPLNRFAQRGFLDHTHLALTPEGLCLGVTEATIWARSDETFGTSKQRRHDPLETKEKFRWLQGYRHACALQEQLPKTRVVSVADSECDIYEVLVETEKQGETACDYVIRSGQIRSLPEREPEAGGETYRKLQQEMDEAPLVAVREIELPRTPKRKARKATLEVRARRVTLKAPYRKHTTLPEVGINAVSVREVDPPQDDDPVDWLLLTSLPVGTEDEVLQVVDYYKGRWPIEVFFRVLKTGCQVERIQLETSSRLLPCLMLYKIVAWRVLYLTKLGRLCPELPCDVLFTSDEWQPVWKIARDKPIPPKAPALNTFLALLAELGGHNGRANDGPPGPQALWIGIRRMTDFAIAWRAFGPKNHATSIDNEKTRDTCV